MGITKSNQLTIDGGIKLPVDIFELLEISDTSSPITSPLSNDEIYNRIIKNRQNGFTYYDGGVGNITLLSIYEGYKIISIFMGNINFNSDDGKIFIGSACRLYMRLNDDGTKSITANIF